MLNKMLRNKKGFTLIELIVVIAILGILAAVMVPLIGGFIEDANVSRDVGKINQLAGAIGTELVRNNDFLKDVTTETVEAALTAGTPNMFATAGVSADEDWSFTVADGVLTITLGETYGGRIVGAQIQLTGDLRSQVTSAYDND